jgi:hypothetical protein
MLLHTLRIIFVFLLLGPNSKAQNIDTESSLVGKKWAIDKGYWGGPTVILSKKMSSFDTSKVSAEFIKNWSFIDKFTPTIFFKKDGKVDFYEFIDCLVGEDLQYFSKFDVKGKYLHIQHKIINWEEIDKYRKKIPTETEFFGYKYEFNIPYDTLKYRIDFVSDQLVFLSLWSYHGKIESPSTYKTKFHRYKEDFESLPNKEKND